MMKYDRENNLTNLPCLPPIIIDKITLLTNRHDDIFDDINNHATIEILPEAFLFSSE